MKLAEALLLRKELKTKIEQLRVRAVQNALVQEGDAPVENAMDLLREVNDAVRQWGDLVQRINATNNAARLADGDTISQAIVRRDELDLQRTAVEAVLNQAVIRQDRYGRAEIKFVAAVDVTALRRESDALAKARREIETQIQGANWNVDLLESEASTA